MNSLTDLDSRTHRQELITWWDQQKLRDAKVLVVGAGALGNEIVKNLLLVGIGEIHVCDMDTIENSNLSRCVFFSNVDIGEFKAIALAKNARPVAAESSIFAHTRTVQSLGAGFMSGFDLVIGGLDNREARLWVNQVCRKLGIPWVDGAIEGLQGRVRFFGEKGACYECTLTEADFIQLAHRRSCSLLSPEDLIEGKTPTTASSSSVVAGIQVQEAIKFITGNQNLLGLNGKCWVFLGDTMETYTIAYTEDPNCNAHDRYTELLGPIEVESLRDMLSEPFLRELESVVAIDFEDELYVFESCSSCGLGEKMVFAPFAKPVDARCKECNSELVSSLRTSVDLSDPMIDLSLKLMGEYLQSIFTVRTEKTRLHVRVVAK